MPLFTQKHFVVLADVIHHNRLKIKAHAAAPEQGEMFDKDLALQAVADLTMDLITHFKADNPKFDQFKFVEAAHKDLNDHPE